MSGMWLFALTALCLALIVHVDYGVRERGLPMTLNPGHIQKAPSDGRIGKEVDATPVYSLLPGHVQDDASNRRRSVANKTSLANTSIILQLLGVPGPQREAADVVKFEAAFKAANLDVEKGFKLDAWKKAFIPRGNLEKKLCDTRKITFPNDCLSSILEVEQLFDVMDLDDNGELYLSDIIIISFQSCGCLPC